MSRSAAIQASKRRTGCPRDNDCSCLPKARLVPGSYQSLLHMDECDDPDCDDLEQLKQLQQSLDTFTDYDHYERCCDGHHSPGACCDTGDQCCDDADLDEDCEDCFDDCDECVEEHQQSHIHERDSPADHSTPVKCDDGCEKCEEECEENGHERKDCPQNHHTSWDSCITTCGMCVDPAPLPLLAPQVEAELYGINSLLPHITPCGEACTPPPNLDDFDMNLPSDVGSGFDIALDHWQTFQQAHHCAPDPCLASHGGHVERKPSHVDPDFGFSFACDPMIPGNQYSWQNNGTASAPLCTFQAFNALDLGHGSLHPLDDASQQLNTFALETPTTSTASPSVGAEVSHTFTPPVIMGKSCQWLMPCGSICGQTFGRTEDLKKHVKNSHLSLKDTVSCRWGRSCTATFATVAALTGHISKKHLAPLYAGGTTTTTTVTAPTDTSSPITTETITTTTIPEELPFKCTFPGCTKSFMYKQVRDDHLASHTGSNKAHCPICHQWLNAEGSNFRRHMASHRPENEHMRCKHQHLGCRRKFPRRDNLRRHEACCKYGKKAAEAAAKGLASEHHHHGHTHAHAHGHHHHHRGGYREE